MRKPIWTGWAVKKKNGKLRTVGKRPGIFLFKKDAEWLALFRDDGVVKVALYEVPKARKK